MPDAPEQPQTQDQTLATDGLLSEGTCVDWASTPLMAEVTNKIEGAAIISLAVLEEERVRSFQLDHLS